MSSYLLYRQYNLDGTIDAGSETDPNFDILPINVARTVGDDGKISTQISVGSEGPTLQAHDNTIQGGLEFKAGIAKLAILAGADLGYLAAFRTTRAYFDGIGADNFLKAYAPRGHFVTNPLYVSGIPGRTTPTGCMMGITGYQRMLNMFSGRIVP